MSKFKVVICMWCKTVTNRTDSVTTFGGFLILYSPCSTRSKHKLFVLSMFLFFIYVCLKPKYHANLRVAIIYRYYRYVERTMYIFHKDIAETKLWLENKQALCNMHYDPQASQTLNTIKNKRTHTFTTLSQIIIRV